MNVPRQRRYPYRPITKPVRVSQRFTNDRLALGNATSTNTPNIYYVTVNDMVEYFFARDNSDVMFDRAFWHAYLG